MLEWRDSDIWWSVLCVFFLVFHYKAFPPNSGHYCRKKSTNKQVNYFEKEKKLIRSHKTNMNVRILA